MHACVYVYRSVEGVPEAHRGEAEPDGEGERRGQEPGRRPEMGKNYDLCTIYTMLYVCILTLCSADIVLACVSAYFY